MNQAQTNDPKLVIPLDTWNDICWNGSLQGHAKKVLDSCEKAVQLAPKNRFMRDSRGLARALTQDFQGAISDFQYFVEHTSDEEAKQQRQSWIDKLQAGENPFTPEVLDSL